MGAGFRWKSNTAKATRRPRSSKPFCRVGTASPARCLRLFPAPAAAFAKKVMPKSAKKLLRARPGVVLRGGRRPYLGILGYAYPESAGVAAHLMLALHQRRRCIKIQNQKTCARRGTGFLCFAIRFLSILDASPLNPSKDGEFRRQPYRQPPHCRRR